jgi:hypothetical protein
LNCHQRIDYEPIIKTWTILLVYLLAMHAYALCVHTLPTPRRHPPRLRHTHLQRTNTVRSATIKSFSIAAGFGLPHDLMEKLTTEHGGRQDRLLCRLIDQGETTDCESKCYTTTTPHQRDPRQAPPSEQSRADRQMNHPPFSFHGRFQVPST